MNDLGNIMQSGIQQTHKDTHCKDGKSLESKNLQRQDYQGVKEKEKRGSLSCRGKASVWDHEKTLEIDTGNGCTILWI